MSTRVALDHLTSYRFEEPVRLFPHLVRLHPTPQAARRVEGYRLQVEPAAHHLAWQQDPFGNQVARLVFPEPAAQLSIGVHLETVVGGDNPFDFFVEDWATTHPFTHPSALASDLAPFLRPVGEHDRDRLGEGVASPGDAVDRFVAQVLAPQGIGVDPMGVVALVTRTTAAVARHVAYRRRLEAGVQSPAETLAAGSGSCRDSAWLLVAVLRRLGLAARFVSGYLVLLGARAASEGDDGDVCDLHAWVEVYLPGAGWIGLDATSGLLAASGHIALAATSHPSTAAPVTGTTSLAGSELVFSTTLTRLS